MMHARPYVSNRYRNEEVDLQPGGSTIVVTTPSDNPFENDSDIEVDTQLSGGMEGGPDAKMKSKKIYTAVANHKHHVRGHVPAVRSISSAHTPLRHGGFMPGMGDTATDAGSATAALLAQTGNVLTSRYQAQSADDAKSIAQSQALIADAQLKKSQADTAFAASIANMGQHSTLVMLALGVGAVALIGALMSKKNASGQVNGSKSTVASLTR